MLSNELAIRITNLSKCYNIYNKPVDRLKQSIIPKALNLLGKPSRAYYREFWALRNLNLEIKKGETLGVIGRNGSGKSTLLQLICGTLTPTTGSVEANGRITALLELGSGFNPEFSGRENIFLNGAIIGLRKEEIEEKFDAIAGFADIGDFIEQPVKFYSSGMTVRLAFAIQAMVDPDILIVDEALAVGDELYQRKCFQRIEHLKKNGTTILFVSHSNHQIIELCDRALLLENGQRLLIKDAITSVKAYHKLIYASQESHSKLIEELLILGESENNIEQDETLIQHDKVHSFEKLSSINQKISDFDFFEENLKPHSKEIYPIQGAEIQSVKIYNDKNQEVNNLLPRKIYRFEIQGTFYEERKDISFLFHSGRVSGPALMSLIYPGTNQYIDKIAPGQKFTLIYRIKMDLTPGTYFVTASIDSTTQPNCIHKIVDAIMFRVLPHEERWAIGYTNLTVGEPEFKVFTSQSESITQ